MLLPMKKILFPALLLLFLACQGPSPEKEVEQAPPPKEQAEPSPSKEEAAPSKSLSLNAYKSGEQETKVLSENGWPSKEGETVVWTTAEQSVVIRYQTEFQPGGISELLHFQLQDEAGQPLGPPLLLYIGEYSDRDAPSSIIRSQAQLNLSSAGLVYEFQSYEENLDTEEKTILQERNSHFLFGGKEGFQEKK